MSITITSSLSLAEVSSGLSRGQYVISIEVGGDMASKKFIVK